LEASLDNVNFYRIARTVVGTTTFDDTTNANAGYAQTYTLSEDIGSYTVLGSARYLTIDADRLVWAGSYENDALASTVGWSPVAQVDGVGNDERQDITTDPTLISTGTRAGPSRGCPAPPVDRSSRSSSPTSTRWCERARARAAYTVVVISKDRGALHGSVVSGVDQLGRPCTYFLDPNVGPCRYGAGGLEWCGSDIRESWTSVHLDAAKVVCSGLYDPVTRQVQWNIATGSSDTPNLGITLQTDSVRADENGTHRGWATWDGNRTTALAMCLYSSNIEAGVARNRILRPFIGLEGNGLVHLCDTGNTDNGTAYTARVVSKPYVLQTIMSRMGVMAGALLAKAVTGASVGLRITRDFGLEDQ
jgi:hypothetical protein